MWVHFIYIFYMNFSWICQHESFAWYVFLSTGICGDLRLGKALGSQGVSFNGKHPRKGFSSPRNREVVQSQPRKLPRWNYISWFVREPSCLLISHYQHLCWFSTCYQTYDLTIRRTLALPSHARTRCLWLWFFARNFRHPVLICSRRKMFAIYVKVCSRPSGETPLLCCCFRSFGCWMGLGQGNPPKSRWLDEEMAMAQWLVISVKLQGTKMWVIRESFQWNFMEILSEIIKIWLAGKSPKIQMQVSSWEKHL